MAMNQYNVPDTSPGLFNATATIPPLNQGYLNCAPFYGNSQNTQDCRAAIAMLPTGSNPVDYINDGRGSEYHLPHHKTSRNCMIQIELAGQRTPARFTIAPDTVRAMASRVLDTCDINHHQIGGFATTSLEGMAGWLTSADGELNANMPHYSSFLTVSVTTPFSVYIAPGNYDPTMATLFAQVESDEADKFPPNSAMARKLQARGARLRFNERLMEPRGRRIPWWTVPPGPPPPPPRPSGSAQQENTAQGAGAVAVAGSPPAPGSEGSAAAIPEQPQQGGQAGTATARKARRRRRGGMGEEGLMG
ncbi:MAG: hypothetical protein Q9168_000179 [Polycauliona sp. 1 TL-2023]